MRSECTELQATCNVSLAFEARTTEETPKRKAHLQVLFWQRLEHHMVTHSSVNSCFVVFIRHLLVFCFSGLLPSYSGNLNESVSDAGFVRLSMSCVRRCSSAPCVCVTSQEGCHCECPILHDAGTQKIPRH